MRQRPRGPDLRGDLVTQEWETAAVGVESWARTTPWSHPIGPAATGGKADTGCRSVATCLVGWIGFSTGRVLRSLDGERFGRVL